MQRTRIHDNRSLITGRSTSFRPIHVVRGDKCGRRTSEVRACSKSSARCALWSRDTELSNSGCANNKGDCKQRDSRVESCVVACPTVIERDDSIARRSRVVCSIDLNMLGATDTSSTQLHACHVYTQPCHHYLARAVEIDVGLLYSLSARLAEISHKNCTAEIPLCAIATCLMILRFGIFTSK